MKLSRANCSRSRDRHRRSEISIAELFLIQVILERKALALWPYQPPTVCASNYSDFSTTCLTVPDSTEFITFFKKTWLYLHGAMAESPIKADPACLVLSPKLSSEGQEWGQPACSASPCRWMWTQESRNPVFSQHPPRSWSLHDLGQAFWLPLDFVVSG